MGDELRRKTGSAAILFMVFGEPDIEVRQADDDQVVVEINSFGRSPEGSDGRLTLNATPLVRHPAARSSGRGS